MFGYGFNQQGPWFLGDGNDQPFPSGAQCLEYAKAQVFFADMSPDEKNNLKVFVAQIEEVSLGEFAYELGEGFLGDLKERVISQITDDGAEEVVSAMETVLNSGYGEVDEEGVPESLPAEVMLDISGNLRGMVDWWADKYGVPKASKTVKVWAFKEDDPWRS